MTLREIINLYPILNISDDSHGTDKDTVHDYVNGFYEKGFAKYQNSNINLLEIGINAGGSLFLWSKFFTNAKIYGIDIQDRVKPYFKDVNNVQHIFANAYDPNIIDTLPQFDIIIDDGPHTLESQIYCINNYMKKLNDGGIMIIEDIQRIEHIELLKNCLSQDLKSKSYCIDVRNSKGRYDDILFIVEK